MQNNITFITNIIIINNNIIIITNIAGVYPTSTRHCCDQTENLQFLHNKSPIMTTEGRLSQCEFQYGGIAA